MTTTTMKRATISRDCPLMRPAGPPEEECDFTGVQIDDARLAAVLPPDSRLLKVYEGAIFCEGPAWQASHRRLLWSDVPNRRLLALYDDGHVEAAIDTTHFMNGNAVLPDGRVVHCEHGRRCISISSPDLFGEPEPLVTRFEGKRLNSPNDITVAPDGAIWFTDPIFGLVMPSQGSLREPDLDHCSVYRFDYATDTLHRMADFEQPNGVGFSPDGRTLYVSDTSRALGQAPGLSAGHKHEVEAFDIGGDGTLSNRRFFCHADHGIPDGFAVDSRGWVWVSGKDGVHVWSPDREKLGFIPVSATVANLTFDGASGRRLFMAATTSMLAIDLIG